MAEKLTGYYDRFDPDKNYEQHLFIAGRALQSAELNEIQLAANFRLKQIGDSLFKDGDIVRDARAIVAAGTGQTTLESGAVYLRGQVRGVPAATITIPVTGTVVIGIYLEEENVTSAQDPTLLDPARETRNYQEPGAERLRVVPKWGYQGDGSSTGEFFPIYYADDGQLRAKEAPPQLDSITQAIARYDRDSTGSSYIVSGMRVSQLADLADGTQVYTVDDGRARVNGFGVILNTSRRIEYPAQPDQRYIDSEPHVSTTASAQRVNLDRTPIATITQVRITAEKTVSLVHGSFTGSQDPLPDTSVVDIIEVKQGATTYVKGTDYKLTSGRVDWSLDGAEPAPGSTYSVKYQFIETVDPTNVDYTGFTVTGAVPGTLILTNYYVKLPRIDRLCMDDSGAFFWVQGVATDYDPVRPQVPSNVMTLCQVIQTWTDERRVINDGVRVVKMADLEAMSSRMDVLTDLIAQQKLVSDLGVREAAAKKGVFVDPFIDDNQRDQGLPQTAAVVFGALTIPIDGDAHSMTTDVGGITSCAYTLVPILEQTSRTGGMKINPYMAFAIPPSQVTLTPAVDRWTETHSTWLSPVTQSFIAFDPSWHGVNLFWASSSTSTQLVSSTTSEIYYLRQIEVRFEAPGFGPGETLTRITFDGIAVAADPI